MADIQNMEESPHDNQLLGSFYESHRNVLLQYLIGEMPNHVKIHIAVMLNNSRHFPSEWREYAYRMGIVENYILDKIESASEVRKEMPIYLAMNYLNDRSIVQIFDALLSLQRYDVLYYLEPYARARVELYAED